MSTNDSVFFMATGLAGAPRPDDPGSKPAGLQPALDAVCSNLARQIVLDGEGATRLASITVSGGKSEEQAERVAHAVARSLLVKTALFGGDPNWGRVLAAVGASGSGIRVDKLDITYGGIPVFKAGQPVEPLQGKELVQIAAEKEVPITIGLNLGSFEVTVLTTDLTVEFVRFNAEYTT